MRIKPEVIDEETKISFPGSSLSCDCTGERGHGVFRQEADFKLYLRLLGEYNPKKNEKRFFKQGIPINIGDSLFYFLKILANGLKLLFDPEELISNSFRGNLFNGKQETMLCQR